MSNRFRDARCNLFGSGLSFFLLSLCSLCLCGESAFAAKITYDEHVLPLFREKCLACHNPDKKSAGLILSNYVKVMEGSSSGAIVKPGDVEGSALYRVMAHKEEPFMPPKSPMLPKESLAIIEQWIAGGALENAGSKAIASKPRVDVGLTKVIRGKPEGPPPMPPRTLTLEPVVRTAKANAITALAASPWAPLIAVAGQKQVLLYHSDTLELLGVLPFPEGVPYVLKFSRSGSLLLAGGGRGGKSGRVVVWSVTRGERILEAGEETDAVLAADISPDQTQVALGGPSKVVRIYSTRDGKLVHEIRKHTDWVTALEYSPDGVLLTSGDRSGGLLVWEAFTAREYFSLRGHTAAITDISWRADGNVCASSSEDGTVRLWEMENGGAIKAWGAHGGGTESVRYGRDGRLVSCGRDRLAKVWDGNGAAQRTFEAFPDVALRGTFSHDGGRVVAGDWTGQIVVWNTADGKRLGQLSANPPTLAEQVELAVKELAVRQKTHNDLAAVVTASRASSQKVSADLAAVQKTLAESGAKVKAAQDAVNQAMAMVQKTQAAAQAATSEVRAREVLAQALTEAAAKVQAASAAAKGDRALETAAARARELAAQAAAEKAAAQKAVTDLATSTKAAEAALATARQNLMATTSAVAAAPRQIEALQTQVKAATAKAAADQAALDQATAALTAATAHVEKCRAALAAAGQARKP
jgi:hypothetical protein